MFPPIYSKTTCAQATPGNIYVTDIQEVLGKFKDSAVAPSISIMLLAAGFFGFSSFTCATSPFILDAIPGGSLQRAVNCTPAELREAVKGRCCPEGQEAEG